MSNDIVANSLNVSKTFKIPVINTHTKKQVKNSSGSIAYNSQYDSLQLSTGIETLYFQPKKEEDLVSRNLENPNGLTRGLQNDISAQNIRASKTITIPVISSLSNYSSVPLASLVYDVGLNNVYFTSNIPSTPFIPLGGGSRLASAGGAVSLVKSGVPPNLSILGLTAGQGITIVPDGLNDFVTITNTGVISLTAGTGISITGTISNPVINNISPASSLTLVSEATSPSSFSVISNASSSPGFLLKTLIAGSNITITENIGGTDLLISAFGGGGIVDSINAGTGISVTGTISNPIINNTGILIFSGGSGISVSGTVSSPIIDNTGIISLVAGTGISITGTSSNPVINNTSSPASSITLNSEPTSLSTFSLVSNTSVNPTFLTKTISSGANVNITQNIGGTDLLLSVTSGIGNILSIAGGTNISVTGTAQNPIVNNTGVVSLTAGTGMSLSGTPTNPVVDNAGVLSLTAGTQITLGGTPQNRIVNNVAPLVSAITLASEPLGIDEFSIVSVSSSNPNFVLKTLAAGSNVTITQNIGGTDLLIDTTPGQVDDITAGTGTSITGTLVNRIVNNTGVLTVASGAGISISGLPTAPVITNTGVITVTGGTGISVTGGVNRTINNTSSTASISMASVNPFYFSIISTSSVNPNFMLKTISRGSSVDIISSSTDIVINSTAGGIVQSITSGTGISVVTLNNVATISNIGVLSVTSGPGITLTGTLTVPVVNNTGVISFIAGTGISIGGTTSNPIITNSLPSSDITLTDAKVPGLNESSLIAISGTPQVFITNTVTAGSNVVITQDIGQTDLLFDIQNSTLLNSVTAGSGISITGTPEIPIINNLGVLTVTQGSGVTVGGTASTPSIVNSEVLLIASGPGITIGGTSTDPIVTNTLSATIININSEPAGGSVYSVMSTSNANPAFKTKTISSRSNMTVTSSGTTLTLNAIQTGQNAIITRSYMDPFTPVRPYILSNNGGQQTIIGYFMYDITKPVPTKFIFVLGGSNALDIYGGNLRIVDTSNSNIIASLTINIVTSLAIQVLQTTTFSSLPVVNTIMRIELNLTLSISPLRLYTYSLL